MPFTFVYRTADIYYISMHYKLQESTEISAVRYTIVTYKTKAIFLNIISLNFVSWLWTNRFAPKWAQRGRATGQVGHIMSGFFFIWVILKIGTRNLRFVFLSLFSFFFSTLFRKKSAQDILTHLTGIHSIQWLF